MLLLHCYVVVVLPECYHHVTIMTLLYYHYTALLPFWYCNIVVMLLLHYYYIAVVLLSCSGILPLCYYCVAAMLLLQCCSSWSPATPIGDLLSSSSEAKEPRFGLAPDLMLLTIAATLSVTLTYRGRD